MKDFSILTKSAMISDTKVAAQVSIHRRSRLHFTGVVGTAAPSYEPRNICVGPFVNNPRMTLIGYYGKNLFTLMAIHIVIDSVREMSSRIYLNSRN